MNIPVRFTEAEFEELVELYPKHYPYLERVRMAFRAVGRSCPDRLSSVDRAWLSESIQNVVAHSTAEEEFKAMWSYLKGRELEQHFAGSESGKTGVTEKAKQTELFYNALRREFAAWRAKPEHQNGCAVHRVPHGLCDCTPVALGPKKVAHQKLCAVHRVRQDPCDCIPATPNSTKKVEHFYREIRSHLPPRLRPFKRKLSRSGGGFITLTQVKRILSVPCS